MRVTHCPVNVAGIPWMQSEALRRAGVESRLVVFNRRELHPEADRSLDLHGGRRRQQLTRYTALARLLPQTDIFHFYFAQTLVPRRQQFRILNRFGKKSVMHFLGSDVRGKPLKKLEWWDRRADALIVGSYDAIRWIPQAHVVPVGIDLASFTPVPPSDGPRPLVVHAPSNPDRKGTAYVVEACERLGLDLDVVTGVPHTEARERYRRADIVVDQLNAGWHGVFALEAMALGKPVLAYLKEDVVEKSEAGFGLRVPIVPTSKETLADDLRPLVEDTALRREIGARSRAYVERVHDSARVAERLLDIYRGL